jgi:hypothetical protein
MKIKRIVILGLLSAAGITWVPCCRASDETACERWPKLSREEKVPIKRRLLERNRLDLNNWYEGLYLEFGNDFLVRMTMLYSGIEHDRNALLEWFRQKKADLCEEFNQETDRLIEELAALDEAFNQREAALKRLLARQKKLIEGDLHQQKAELDDAFNQRMAELEKKYSGAI